MSDICNVAHCLPLGGVGRDFLFTEDETQRQAGLMNKNSKNCVQVNVQAMKLISISEHVHMDFVFLVLE